MRPIDADKLKAYKCSICDNRERCEDRETVCSEIAEIDEQPTIEAEPVKRGRWIMREKDKLIPTGKIAVSEGHILNKTSFDEPFTLQSANIIQIKEHRTVKIPYCSECGNHGDDKYDATPYCPNCGAKMKEDNHETDKNNK